MDLTIIQLKALTQVYSQITIKGTSKLIHLPQHVSKFATHTIASAALIDIILKNCIGAP